MFANENNNMQTFGTREDKGKAIAEKAGQMIRINDQSYKVKSQSSDVLYDVMSNVATAHPTAAELRGMIVPSLCSFIFIQNPKVSFG